LASSRADWKNAIAERMISFKNSAYWWFFFMGILSKVFNMEISNTQPPLQISQIIELETKYSLRFPKDYIDHLLKYNGGVSDLEMFSFEENNIMTQSSLSRFLAIYEGKYNNLEDYILTMKVTEKRMPSHILPIARDEFGNLVCISCAGSDLGYIYFWNHEKEVDYNISDDTDYSNLYFIAKNLPEFLESLTEPNFDDLI
jgi:hypothetical protein